GIVVLGAGEVNQMTPDARVLVGEITPPFPGDPHAFRYTDTDGIVDLGVAPGFQGSNALAVSADGNTVVGFCTNTVGNHIPFRWTASTGMVALGDIPGGRGSAEALAVSGDGSAVVGGGLTLSGGAGQAFIWDQSHGMRILADVLRQDYQMDLTGWQVWGA